MQINYQKWHEAIAVRRSRRSYDPAKPIPLDLLEHMRSFCAGYRPFPGARAELISGHCDEIFRGFIGSYGKIKGADHAVAFIGNMDNINVHEQTGYMGEGIILEATVQQLATCWVAGFFRPKLTGELLKISKPEKVLAVTPLGYAPDRESRQDKYMARSGRNHQRKPLAKLVTGLNETEWPAWVKTALEAARQAPSAINRQPWSFHVEPGAITVSVRTRGPEFTVAKRLDCGIAMLHIEASAAGSGIAGKWEFLKSPGVARFRYS